MKYWAVIFVLTLVACSSLQPQLPLSTATSIPPTFTPQIIQVTRIVTIKQTMVVTATPEPPLAQECFNKALTQGDLNNCANLERELAKEELEKIISRIKFSPEEKQVFDHLQMQWENKLNKIVVSSTAGFSRMRMEIFIISGGAWRRCSGDFVKRNVTNNGLKN